MVDCIVKNWQGEEVGNASLTLRVAKEENAAHIVHRALVRQQNNARQGNASAKTRAEVRGGGSQTLETKGYGAGPGWFDSFSPLAGWWCDLWA